MFYKSHLFGTNCMNSWWWRYW